MQHQPKIILCLMVKQDHKGIKACLHSVKEFINGVLIIALDSSLRTVAETELCLKELLVCPYQIVSQEWYSSGRNRTLALEAVQDFVLKYNTSATQLGPRLSHQIFSKYSYGKKISRLVNSYLEPWNLDCCYALVLEANMFLTYVFQLQKF